jgi:hypothetical protein
MTYEYPLSWPPGFPRTKYPCPVTLRCAGACPDLGQLVRTFGVDRGECMADVVG